MDGQGSKFLEFMLNMLEVYHRRKEAEKAEAEPEPTDEEILAGLESDKYGVAPSGAIYDRVSGKVIRRAETREQTDE